MNHYSHSESDTLTLGKALASKSTPGSVYCLNGDLGTGKTTFAKGFALGLGIADNITSPSYNLLNEYMGHMPLYHFDLYRLNGPQARELGFEEYFYGSGVCLIEWAENAMDIIPSGHINIDITKDLGVGEHFRLIKIR